MRCFIAVPFLPDKVILQIMDETMEKYGKMARFPDPSNMHLTLDFFADITEKQAGERWESLNFSAFEGSIISPTGIGHFPAGQKSRVLYIDIDRELFMEKNANLYREKTFSWSYGNYHPHVTICRFKSPTETSPLEDKYRNYSFHSQKPARIMLVKSILGQSGPSYNVLKTAQLM